MAYFLLERPATGACRVWLQRLGKPPILLSPLSKHRRLFGDLYDWGKGEKGCHLTAATLAVHCGLRGDVAALLAPRIVEDVLIHEHRRLVRLEFDDLATILLNMVEDDLPKLIEQLIGRGKGVRIG